MIFYLVNREHSYSVKAFADDWEPSVGERMRALYYQDLPSIAAQAEHPLGTYIFSDLERLSSDQLHLANQLWTTLSRAGCRMLNHPLHSLKRLDLLQLLRQRGDNLFGAYRLSDTTQPRRFPVFLRPEKAHEISSPLLNNPEELAAAIDDNLRQERTLDELLMIEFLDTSDAHGLYRKYGATFIAGEVIPHGLMFGTDWMVRVNDQTDAAMLEEEWRFLTGNPHHDWVRYIFRLANIEYGRIDYALFEGRPQAWEINTNPVIVSNRRRSPTRVTNRKRCAQLHRQAYEALDDRFEQVTAATSIRPGTTPVPGAG